MQFKKGSEVFSGDGELIGTLSRVIIDPRTREVSELVVEKGAFFKTDKVVPITLVDLEVKDRIVLKKTNQDILKDFPDFETVQYVPLDEPENPYQTDIDAYYWYPPGHLGWTTSGHVGYSIPQFVPKTTEDIPEGKVALEEGAKVISRDKEHVGNVEEIITEPQGRLVTHFVVSEGFLLKERKLIPATWISDVIENEIHLSVDSRIFERLPEYQPAD